MRSPLKWGMRPSPSISFSFTRSFYIDPSGNTILNRIVWFLCWMRLNLLGCSFFMKSPFNILKVITLLAKSWHLCKVLFKDWLSTFIRLEFFLKISIYFFLSLSKYLYYILRIIGVNNCGSIGRFLFFNFSHV